MPKALLISHNEICYNARLLKAADTLSEQGWDVTVFNPITGIASEKVYNETIQKRSWKILENDISRRTPISKLRWLIASLIHRFIILSVNEFRLKTFDHLFMNKGYLFFPWKKCLGFDLYIVHLIDSLPLAAKLKSKYGGRLLYDSQEYFRGQYSKMEEDKFRWVKRNEAHFISQVDILLTTTNVMKERLLKDYSLTIPVIRVRNLPTLKQKIDLTPPKELTLPIKLIWHGMAIYFNNRRGVHILVQALAYCKSNVKLFLQGNFPESQKKILTEYVKELGLEGKIETLPAANPDEIVASLKDYDIGLTGELSEEENQELTSSNKLFDYINAGLAVVSSNTKGLEETIKEYKVGEVYRAGDIIQLAGIIDELAMKQEVLNKFKEASYVASKKLYWEQDYIDVVKLVSKNT